jgi:hypothetical protein
MSEDTEQTETGVPQDRPPLAREVIEDLMIMWRKKIPPIVHLMIENATKQGKPIEALKLFNNLKEASEHALDAAAKLLPVQTPKLESIQVKSEVEHKFVIRAPAQILSIDEWAKQTGATRVRTDQQAKLATVPEPSCDYADAEANEPRSPAD